MTWSTESVSTSTAVKRKKDFNHCHNRKRFTLKSRGRPSVRHHVTVGRSRYYSTGTDVCKKTQDECSEVDDGKSKRIPHASTDKGCFGVHSSVATEGCASPKKKIFRKQAELCTPNHDHKPVSSQPTTLVKSSLPDSTLQDQLFVSHGTEQCCSPVETGRKAVGPEISVIEDTYSSGKNHQRTWRGDLRPQISMVQDVYAPGQFCEKEVQHLTINADVRDRDQEGGKKGSRIWRVLRVSLSRRKGSKRNGNKFTVRRKKSATVPTPAGKVEPHSKEKAESRATQQEQEEEKPISIQDIQIDFEHEQSVAALQSSLPSQHAPCGIGAGVIRQCVEEIDSLESHHKATVPAAVSSYRRKPKACRRIQIRLRRRPRKIIVIGDMCSGKTNLISVYSQDKFTDTYMPTMLRCCLTDARICHESIELVVVDISGRDDFEPLRRCAYHKMDAAVICYSVDSAACFERIRDFWVPELRKHSPKVPFVLVGTKRDIKDLARDKLESILQTMTNDYSMAARLRAEVSFGERFVSEDRGKRMASSVGAAGFMECSSLYRDGTREVFEMVTKIALKKTRRLRRDNRHVDTMCSIL